VVHIVTGKINSGKTTRLIAIFDQLQRGNGIVSKKYMNGQNVLRFQGMILKSRQEFPYLVHEREIKKENHDVFITNIGPYYLYGEAQTLIDRFYDGEIENQVEPLFFDEIGKLELSGQGFHNALSKALRKGLEVYLCIREDLVLEVIQRFNIRNYEII